MKNFKYILLGAMMTAIAAPMSAQTDLNSVMNQVKQIMTANTEAKLANKQIDAFAKTYKKDAPALAAIGRMYMLKDDYPNAEKYADMAIKANSKMSAGYLLKGEIFAKQNDGGNACMWYEQAIMNDPKDPEAYKKYAIAYSRIDPNGAMQKLEELKVQRPDYPVDLIAAEIFFDAGKADQAITYYEKAPREKMDNESLVHFATALFGTKQMDKALEVAKYGQSKNPRYAPFNRLGLIINTELKNFDVAVKDGDALFNKSDSATIKSLDYGYFARALEGAKDYTQAIAIYEQYQGLEEVGADEKNAIFKSISECYKNLGDYDKAVEFYSKYVNSFEKPSFTMQEDVVKIYTSLIQNPNNTDEQKMEAYKKADAIYATLMEKYPDNGIYIANMRGRLPFYLTLDGSGLDDNAKNMKKLEMAAPHFETLAGLVEAKGDDASAAQKKSLASAYNYLIPYYIHIKNDMDTAKKVAEKLIVIDPENGNAKAILGI